MKFDFTNLGASPTSPPAKAATATTAGAGAMMFDFGAGDEPITPGGVSLTPIEIEIDEVNPEIAKEAAAQDFLKATTSTMDLLKGYGFNVPDERVVTPDVSGMLTADLLEAYQTQQVNETARINNVLYDLVPNYAGGTEQGPLDLGDKDTLFRMPRFEQRQKWLKKKFPDGELFRVDTGNGNFVELYKTAPSGKAYRVSDDVFSLADVGELTGSLANFTTAGSVVGAFFGPLLGTAAGAYVGATIDEFVANALATDALTSLGINSSEEFNTRFLAGDRAVVALVDGALTTALPILGKTGSYVLKKATDTAPENASLLYELGFFSVNPKAAAAQSAAASIAAQTGVKIEPLNIAQLSNSVLLRGMASQASGTAKTLPQALSTAETRVLAALNKKVNESNKGLLALSDDELLRYLQLQNIQLGTDVQLAYRASTGGRDVLRDFDETATSIVGNAKILDQGYARAIDNAYKKAFSLAGASNVTIDLSPVLQTAARIKAGLRVTAKPEAGRSPSGIPLKKDAKGRTVFAAEKDVRSRDFGGDLASIIRRLETFDPTLKTVKVKAVGSETTAKNIDAFSQLKDIRDQIQDAVKTSDNPSIALELLASVDDLIINGIEKGLIKGGDDAWRKSYNEAGTLVRMRSDAKNQAALGTLLGRRAENLPETVTNELLEGKLNGEQFKLLRRLVFNTALTEGEKTAGLAFIRDIQEAGVAKIIRNEDGLGVIKRLKSVDEGQLYNALFPKGSANRKALEKYERGASLLSTDPAQKVINQNFEGAEAALNYVRAVANAPITQSGALRRFIEANGGIDGEVAQSLRAVLLKDIVDGGTIVQKESGVSEFGDDIINAEVLSKSLSELKRAILEPNSQSKYAVFKPLFGELAEDGSMKFTAKGREYFNLITDTQLYTAFLSNTGDIGGPFATGAIRAQAASGTIRGTLSAGKSLLSNRLLSYAFSARPSVPQLKRAIGKQPFAKRLDAATALLIQVSDGLNLGEKDQGVTIGGIGSSLGPETIREETERTGRGPQLGNVPERVDISPVSQSSGSTAAPSIAPSIIPATPPDNIVAGQPAAPTQTDIINQNLQAGIQNLDDKLKKSQAMQTRVANVLAQPQTQNTGTFRNLFPFDSIGQAIENSRLGQGIARLVR